MQGSLSVNDIDCRPVIFGEVLYDCFPDGEAVLGGAPFNVAWHLQGLGLSPLFISRVGDDPLGHRVRDIIERRGAAGFGAPHRQGQHQPVRQQPQFRHHS
jgi:hypothetical protein